MEQQRIVHDVTQSSSSRQVNRSLHTTIETTIIQDTTTTQITTTAVSNHTTHSVVPLKEISNTTGSHPTQPKHETTSCIPRSCVTYYRYMWPRCSHILAPLTNILKIPKSTKEFPWLPTHDKAFQQMKSACSSPR